MCKLNYIWEILLGPGWIPVAMDRQAEEVVTEAGLK